MPRYKLLTSPDENAKLSKANGTKYYNIGLTLAPAKTSGYQVCPSSTPGCRSACLSQVGLAQVFTRIHEYRQAKTRRFFEDRAAFLADLLSDLIKADRFARKSGLRVAFRPNVLSDIRWERVFPTMFTEFPDWIIYSYTKHKSLARKYGENKLPCNYHITYSAHEKDSDDDIRKVLSWGCNVAIPFYPTPPEEYLGFRVVNGDGSDLRFLDPRGVIVGLSAKLPIKKTSRKPFVDQSGGFIRCV